MKRDEALKILATSGLLLVDAMVFQEILARKLNIDTISAIKSKRNVKKALEENWEKILKKNYEPIFEIALNILREIPASPQVNDALRDLLNISYDIASSTILLKHDLFGRIYHKLLLGKLTKYYATYYTSIPAARLLARLLVNLPSNINLKELPPRFNGNLLKVVDFACGSGTLLSAVYKELDIKHRLEAENPNPQLLHKYLIEEGLWGFDVLQHATHLASTTLCLHEPYQSVDGSRIYALKLGVSGKDGKEVYLGSINFLENRKITSKMLLTGSEVGPVKVSVSEGKVTGVELPGFHICVMNPPFTRSVGGNLLFGGLPSEERKTLQKKLSDLLDSKKLTGIGQAGLGAIFVFLADEYLENEGRMGLVLPKAILAGVAWKKVREKLLKDYHIEYIISSFEGPNDWNFSEKTSLSEILLVAKKVKEKANYTIFVNLWRKPRSEIEAISIGSQILEIYKNPKLFDIGNSNATAVSIRLRGKKIGEAYSVVLTDSNFGCFNMFAQAELNRIVVLLRHGVLYLPKEGRVGNIPIAPLSKFIKDIGPDRRQVHNAFKVDDTGIYKAFWGYDSNKMKSIKQESNAKLKPKSGRVDTARKLWKKSGKLLIVERARLSTYRLLSVIVAENVLSNVWWPIIPKSEDEAKLLALWLNSTYGLLLLLSIAEVTEGPWIGFKKEHLWNLPVIDFSKLSEEHRERLLELYNEVSGKCLKPLPKEFAEPKVRKNIDDIFGEIFNVRVDLTELYEMLSKEPTISGNPL